MRFGINAGFGEPIRHEFSNLKRLRFTDLRQDMQNAMSEASFQYLAAEFRYTTFDLRPLYLIRPDQVTLLEPGERAEVLNEPNFHMPAEQYARMWDRIAEHTLMHGITLYFGAISNLNQDALAWLQRAYDYAEIKPTHVSVHRYPRDGGFSQAHRGFRSREHEVDALRDIVGDAKVAVTEFGYHTARRWRWKVWPTRWNNAKVAEYVAAEWNFWSSVGVESAYLYQLNDGPSRHYEDRFGIRDINGNWKPSSHAHL